MKKILFLLILGLPQIVNSQMDGPLRTNKVNYRYFTDNSGKAVYLAGSHNWADFMDRGNTNPPEPFNYTQFLDFLQQYNHNCYRLWHWDCIASENEKDTVNTHQFIFPHPWKRSGNGNAIDGLKKFDLNVFNEEYFARIRQHVEEAKKRNIYVAVMLFEGWQTQFKANAWRYHILNPLNSDNSVDADLNKDGKGFEVYTLESPGITSIQERYVKKVLETLNNLDNVLYEITNEAHPNSTEWQYHFIDFIHNYEKGLPKQHPVGMTFQFRGGKNTSLFESNADWVSPNHEGVYRDNPPTGNTKKVIISDTDHLWGVGGNIKWVWASFTRGMNLWFMDPYRLQRSERTEFPESMTSWLDTVRVNMGFTVKYSHRMDLNLTTPQNQLSSTTFCLANPGKEYLVFQPEKGGFTVSLKPGSYNVEWFNPQTRNIEKSERIKAKDKVVDFKAPFHGSSVLFINKR